MFFEARTGLRSKEERVFISWGDAKIAHLEFVVKIEGVDYSRIVWNSTYSEDQLLEALFKISVGENSEAVSAVLDAREVEIPKEILMDGVQRFCERIVSSELWNSMDFIYSSIESFVRDNDIPVDAKDFAFNRDEIKAIKDSACRNIVPAIVRIIEESDSWFTLFERFQEFYDKHFGEDRELLYMLEGVALYIFLKSAEEKIKRGR